MTNTNIQAGIPLIGRGLTKRLNGNYEQGEFSACTNLEIIDGQIVSRRPIQYVYGDTDGVAFHYQRGTIFNDPVGFVGYDTTDRVMFAARDKMIRTGGDARGEVVWSPTSLPVGAGDSYHNVVGYFEYNKRYYWITERFDVTGGTVKWFLYHMPNTGDVTSFAALTATEIKSQTAATAQAAKKVGFQSFFVYKDRLWIVSNSGVYFSKATDPLVWATPEGGFIRSSDATRYWAVPTGDSVYIGTDSNLYVFSFSADPNEDAYLMPIALIGVNGMCANKERAFFTTASRFYEIVNNNIVPVFDFDEVGLEYVAEEYKLVSSGDLILFLPRTPLNLTPYTDKTASFITLNTLHGFISEFTFREDYNSGVFDAMYLPDKHYTFFASTNELVNDTRLYFQSNAYRERGGIKPSSDAPNPSNLGLDMLYLNDTVEYRPIPVELEIPSFVPDGNEYMNKKFRNLLLEGQLPFTDFWLKVAYNAKDRWSKNTPLLNNNLAGTPGAEPPYPFRIGLNQRGRSIFLRFETTPEAWASPVGNDKVHYFTLRDARLFWTYTQRSPETRKPVSSPALN